jgi:hypothetical protein
VRPSAFPNFGTKRRVLTQTLQAVRFHRQDNRGFSSLRDVLFWVVRVMYELKIVPFTDLALLNQESSAQPLRCIDSSVVAPGAAAPWTSAAWM